MRVFDGTGCLVYLSWYSAAGVSLMQEIRRIEQLTIYDIIMSVTDMERDDILPDPFRVLVQGEIY